MHSVLRNLRHRFFEAAENYVKRWLKPVSLSIAGGFANDVSRRRTDLIAENAFLRQQLIILQ